MLANRILKSLHHEGLDEVAHEEEDWNHVNKLIFEFSTQKPHEDKAEIPGGSGRKVFEIGRSRVSDVVDGTRKPVNRNVHHHYIKSLVNIMDRIGPELLLVFLRIWLQSERVKVWRQSLHNVSIFK